MRWIGRKVQITSQEDKGNKKCVVSTRRGESESVVITIMCIHDNIKNIAALERARISLGGLSVGDAFGQSFFMTEQLARNLIAQNFWPNAPFQSDDEIMMRVIDERILSPFLPWRWTDDSEMAFSIYTILREHGEIVPEELAKSFKENFNTERDYGAAMNDLLPQLSDGDYSAASQLFEGKGSWGNGAAMRVAPVGAYFADDLDAVIENARRSALVTHTHEEGVAGAVAVAVATALSFQQGQQSSEYSDSKAFIENVMQYVPQSEVRCRMEQSLELEDEAAAQDAAELLGNGEEISAQDTVPFCIWCAAQYLDYFDEALWLTVAGLGDRDTTCAIVGGIVAPFGGLESIPLEWRQAREKLPTWLF